MGSNEDERAFAREARTASASAWRWAWSSTTSVRSTDGCAICPATTGSTTAAASAPPTTPHDDPGSVRGTRRPRRLSRRLVRRAGRTSRQTASSNAVELADCLGARAWPRDRVGGLRSLRRGAGGGNTYLHVVAVRLQVACGHPWLSRPSTNFGNPGRVPEPSRDGLRSG